MPHIRRFSSYEEAFPDLISPFEAMPPEQQQQPPVDSSIDHNNKLLSFSLPAYSFTLLDYSLRRTSLSVSAQLHGMFFLAESPWTTSPTEAPPPPQVAELTCYRRNLFQIAGSVTLPRGLRYIMTDQGDRIPIVAQELTVSATESVEGNPVKIISVPWKTPAAAQAANGTVSAPPAPEEKAEKEPPSIPLDITSSGQELDSDYATFPVAWKRLQFRIATANNGRRKELQQHFVVRLKVVATLSTGAKIPIAEVRSGPVIVRGRSPRNFQSRKDLPLSGSAASSRKNQQAALNRTPSADNVNQQGPKTPGSTGAPRAGSRGSGSPAALSQIFAFDGGAVPVTTAATSSPPFADWSQMPAPAVVSTTGPMPNSTFVTVGLPNGTVPAYPQSSPSLSRTTEAQRRASVATTAPISLSLVDDEFRTPTRPGDAASTTFSRKRASPDAAPGPQPSKMQKLTMTARPRPNRSSSATFPLLHNIGTSAAAAMALQSPFAPPFTAPLPYSGESTDGLYEYFPLSAEDWQAPVDAVYRPHVVHHMHMPPDYKLMEARSRSARYFTAEDVC